MGLSDKEKEQIRREEKEKYEKEKIEREIQIEREKAKKKLKNGNKEIDQNEAANSESKRLGEMFKNPHDSEITKWFGKM